MRLPDPSYDWMDARVETYLDGGLPAEEHEAFEQALADDADWEAELFLARQIRIGLRTLPQPTCPPHVTEAVLAQVRGEAQVSWKDRFHAWMEQQWTALWQPALAMTFLLLLVVS
ncbi:MAG: anti-sigma factor family protein, partial [Rhodothermales bacterium]